jgi:dynein heavy chain
MPESILDVPSLKRLWVHEVLRVYYDRLIDHEDRNWLYEALQEICVSRLEEDFHQLLIRLDLDGDGIVRDENNNPHISSEKHSSRFTIYFVGV